jgi:hypothetical protein
MEKINPGVIVLFLDIKKMFLSLIFNQSFWIFQLFGQKSVVSYLHHFELRSHRKGLHHSLNQKRSILRKWRS